MAESRTKRASRNVVIGVLSKLIVMIFAFSTKTLFIRLLGVEYNGVNGLYGNILAVLALSELGVGNVLNYSLYSALRNKDTDKVKSLVSYFRRIYYGIALAVSLIGLALVPFLHYIINSDLPIDELITYYLLYLANSVASYFVVYKTTVIIADQNNYISSVCEIAATILMYVAQIVYLLLFKDFLGYLIIQVSCTVLKNALLNFITNKKYPFLKHLSRDKNILPQEDKTKIVDNIKSTFLYKIAAVILNNTDNILISIIVGTVYVGYYSNYYMVISYITVFIGIFITGITASLGNLNSENNNEASYRMFNILSLIFSFIGTICSCCLINCFQPFVKIWIGQDNVMNFSWVVVIVLNLYLNTLMNPIWMFRETMGLFKQVKFIMLITAALNILFSIVLGHIFGVPGILAATFIAKIASQYWYEPTVLFKKLDKPVKLFYVNQIKQIIIMLLAIALSFSLCNLITSGIIGVIIRALISATVALLFVWIFNRKSVAMEQLMNIYIKPNLGKIIKMIHRRNS